jgi:hypothetical protein
LSIDEHLPAGRFVAAIRYKPACRQTGPAQTNSQNLHRAFHFYPPAVQRLFFNELKKKVCRFMLTNNLLFYFKLNLFVFS